MKKLLFLFSTILLSSVVFSQPVRKQFRNISAETNVMTYNIRLDNAGDGINKWDNRRERVIQTILDNQVDILGLQEVLHNQMIDLQAGLPDYEWIGVGRDDGIEKGEYSPIFYNKNKFSEIGSGYFWLSENPMEAGSKGWDAACARIATWAKLKDNRTGNVVFVINTHFDHIGKVARQESVKLILQKINVYTKKDGFPVILTGDFNATPNSDIIKNISDTRNPLHLTNTMDVSNVLTGTDWTFHGFGKTPLANREMLDYVFVKNNVMVNEHHVLPDEPENGIYASDHCPVLVKVQF